MDFVHDQLATVGLYYQRDVTLDFSRLGKPTDINFERNV